MTKEELQKFTESSYEAMKDPSSGQYNLGFSEALAMAAFEPPSWWVGLDKADKPPPPHPHAHVLAISRFPAVRLQRGCVPL